MLELIFTDHGFTANQDIGMSLFLSVGNIVVRVSCKPPYYSTVDLLENRACDYMNQFMPDGIEVKTYHTTLNLSYGSDSRGTYINSVDFQVYI